MTDKNVEQEELGEKLREAREYRGFSKEEIAICLGVSQDSVDLIEEGKREIDSDELEQLAKIYDTTIDGLKNGLTAENGNKEQIDLLTRATKGLSASDRDEVAKFAGFLKQRNPEGKSNE